jgi:hypothetical protein
LYTWGEEDGGMLGRSNPSFSPTTNTFNPGIANGSEGSTAVFAEMGGHTLVYIKVGSDKFCYVGHKSGGSMGDKSSTTTDYVVSFECDKTPVISICDRKIRYRRDMAKSAGYCRQICRQAGSVYGTHRKGYRRDCKPVKPGLIISSVFLV